MLTAIALAVAVVQSPTHLTLAPWTGKNLPTATAAAIKYNLKVAGKPHATIHVEASGVAQGWIAAFCTARLCAPTSVDVTLPDSGQVFYQFELSREDDAAPKKSAAKITTRTPVSAAAASSASARAPIRPELNALRAAGRFNDRRSTAP